MRIGICASLMDHGAEEGLQDAIDTAQKWQTALEDMLECANRGQVEHVVALLECVNTFLRFPVAKAFEVPQPMVFRDIPVKACFKGDSVTECEVHRGECGTV